MGRNEIRAASSHMPAMDPAATRLVTQRPYLRQNTTTVGYATDTIINLLHIIFQLTRCALTLL
jgi:hypothetical protein